MQKGFLRFTRDFDGILHENKLSFLLLLLFSAFFDHYVSGVSQFDRMLHEKVNNVCNEKINGNGNSIQCQFKLPTVCDYKWISIFNQSWLNLINSERNKRIWSFYLERLILVSQSQNYHLNFVHKSKHNAKRVEK